MQAVAQPNPDCRADQAAEQKCPVTSQGERQWNGHDERRQHPLRNAIVELPPELQLLPERYDADVLAACDEWTERECAHDPEQFWLLVEASNRIGGYQHQHGDR